MTLAKKWGRFANASVDVATAQFHRRVFHDPNNSNQTFKRVALNPPRTCGPSAADMHFGKRAPKNWHAIFNMPSVVCRWFLPCVGCCNEFFHPAIPWMKTVMPIRIPMNPFNSKVW